MSQEGKVVFSVSFDPKRAEIVGRVAAQHGLSRSKYIEKAAWETVLQEHESLILDTIYEFHEKSSS